MAKYFLLIFIGIINAQLLHPDTNAILNQIHVRFEWQEHPQTNQYEIYVSDSNDIINDCVICGERVSSNSLIYIAKENLDWNNSYSWQINSLSNDGEILNSNSDTFSIGPSIANATTTLYDSDAQQGLTIFGSFLIIILQS